MILKNLTRAKIKLAIAINFVYSKETDKGLVMHLQNDNIEKKLLMTLQSVLITSL